MKITWQGVFPAVTTQFRRDQSLDLDATTRHVEAMIDSGVHGLIMCGSLGENQTLAADEKLRVIAAAAKAARSRVPVLSGVAEASTEAACRYLKDAQAAGASGFMVMPAMVYKADTREAMTWFRRVAAA